MSDKKVFNSKAEKKYKRAKRSLMILHPFFGPLIVRLKPIQKVEVGTAGVDGESLFYNPEWFNTLSDQEAVCLLAHEVMHCALGHHTRRGKKDNKLWNIACDHAINILLDAHGNILPPNPVMDKKYDGWPSEKIYADIYEDQPQNPGGGAGNGMSGSGTGNSPGSNPGNGQPDPNAPGQWGQILDAPKGSEKESASDWEAATIGAVKIAQMQKSKGTNPGFADRLADMFGLYHKVSWKEVLKNFVQTSIGVDDFTWKRPGRRGLSEDLYLPHREGVKLDGVWVAIDTSGSIDDKTLQMFKTEIEGIMEMFPNSEVGLMFCDARLHNISMQSAPLDFKPKGGGGTDFRPVFNYFEEQYINPKCVIYLTDLYGSFPEEPPFYPTLWVVKDGPSKPEDHVPFGITIVLEEDDD